MLNKPDIPALLPTSPYAVYETECRYSKQALRLFYLNCKGFKKTITSGDHHLFMLNTSNTTAIHFEVDHPKFSKRKMVAQPGQLMLIIPANETLSVHVTSAEKLAIAFIHRATLKQKLIRFSQGRFNSVTVDHSGPFDSPFLVSAINEIESSITDQQNDADSLYLESLYDIVLTKILNKYSTVKKIEPSFKMHSPSQIKIVVNYIHQHLGEEIKIIELATMMNLSQYHFTRIFKEYLGISPYQYILNLRFEKAKHCLEHTDLSVITIANNFGFSSQSHFQSFFKKQTGLTPKAYRQKHKIES